MENESLRNSAAGMLSSPQTRRKGNNLKVKGLWKKNARDVSYVPSRGFNLVTVLSGRGCNLNHGLGHNLSLFLRVPHVS